MNNSEVFTALFERPWMIEAGAYRGLVTQFEAGNLNLSDFFLERPEATIDANGIGHVHCVGVLGKHAPIGKVLGDTDYDAFSSELQELGAEARGVMIHVSSPGGSAVGNDEASKVVADLECPVVSWIDGIGASAAYSIAAGSDEIYATPSSLVGSVGCIIPYVDSSQQWESAGLRADYITSGDLKGAGFPPSLSDAQREVLQQQVDDFFATFKGHVLDHRLVDDDAMRGQCFVAPRAMEANLIDGTASQGEAYARLLSLAS